VSERSATTQRLDYLDGLRGWASLMVVLSHLWGQFARHTVDIYSSVGMRLVSDGHFAVLIFFVLSGTALSLRFVRQPGPLAPGWLVAARYVRLVVPIAATTLIIFTLMKLHWYGSEEAASAAASPIFLGPRRGMPTTFADALQFSTIDVLFRYDPLRSFNSSLWTMPVEFLGSILVYALLFAMSLRSPGRALRMAIGVALGLMLTGVGKPLAACFCGGYVVAEMLYGPPRLLAAGAWIGAVLVAAGAALVVRHGELDDGRGAVLALGTVMCVGCWPVLRRVLSTRLSRWLGMISFPLYLIHTAVIECGGQLYVTLLKQGVAVALATHLTVASALLACLLAARLLMPVEHLSIRWSRAVGRFRLRAQPMPALPD